MGGRDVRRGCVIAVLGLPLCGLLTAGVGGLVLALALLLLTLIGCASPPTTVGYIAYPPDGARVPAGEVIVQLYAYRRGWASLQFESGWAASKQPPEAVSLAVDGEPVFTWERDDDEEWTPRELPLSLAPGEHTLSLAVRAGGHTVQDTVTVTAVADRAWRLWRAPEFSDPSAWFLFTDADGQLWRVARPRLEMAGTFVEVTSWQDGEEMAVGEYPGVILGVEERRVRFFNLETGRDITLTLARPLAEEARVGRLYVRQDGRREMLWFPAWPLEMWDGSSWKTSAFRIPLESFAGARVELVRPDDVWYWGRGPGAVRWDGSRWQLIPPPPDSARLVRAAVALEGRTFFLWDGEQWQPTAPVPRPQDPFALDFAALNSERKVLRCGGLLWVAGNAASWDADSAEAEQRVRVFRWEGRSWTWQDVRPGDEYGEGFLVCVGDLPWLVVQRGAKRRLEAGGPQAANRLGGRFLGPESGIPLEVVRLWQWDGEKWQPAVHAPLWGRYAGDILPGHGLGVVSWATGRAAVAHP